MARMEWRFLGALTLGILASTTVPATADDRFKFNLVIEGRLVTTPVGVSFLDSGLGKTRYGQKPRAVEATLSQAAFLGRFEARPDLTLRVHGNVDAEHNFKRRVDLVEALVRYNPAIGDTVSLDFRAGLFFPTVSLENTDAAWLSPYTTTFSAINSWIGEEVRNLGVEVGPSIRINEAQWRVFGSFARGNDPNGTLLAWRGFSLHDRVSGLGDRLPLPALRGGGVPRRFSKRSFHLSRGAIWLSARRARCDGDRHDSRPPELGK